MSNTVMRPVCDISNIRNFSIIAHVDHGKSTLADRILEICGVEISSAQTLDKLKLEKERGITIKSQSCCLHYEYNNIIYRLNLIDTPGHTDFNHEVSKSIPGCENAFLVIDAAQGVQAQTRTNLRHAKKNNTLIIPVINKVDLPAANIDARLLELIDLGVDITHVMLVSAKTGLGVKNLIEKLIEVGHAPQISTTSNGFRSFIIDSWYNQYLGVVALVRIMSGSVVSGDMIKIANTNKIFKVLNVGVFIPEQTFVDKLYNGDIGFIITAAKDATVLSVGDTLLDINSSDVDVVQAPKSTPSVFCTLYAIDTNQSTILADVLAKYQLNDSAFIFEQENNPIYGLVFKCGFLGLLHIEIVIERLRREYDMYVGVAIPSVLYEVYTKSGEKLLIKNPKLWPSKDKILRTLEPYVKCKIYTPIHCLDSVFNLAREHRMTDSSEHIIDDHVIMIECFIPMGELALNFKDRLLTITSGLGSFEYEIADYRESELSRLYILVNDREIDGFSMIVATSKARTIGNLMVEKLTKLIKRCQVNIKIQAVIDTSKNIVGRADIKAFKTDALKRCNSGGDITRKMKKIEEQKRGKEKMQILIGSNIEIPANATLELTRLY